MSYDPPVKDLLFNIQHLAGIEQISRLPGFQDAGLDIAQAVLEECSRLSADLIAPLNTVGDTHPPRFNDGHVAMPPGFKDAYRQYIDGGWQGLQHDLEFGGQGLPKAIGAACLEIFNAANLSFSLCSLLTDGAIEALLTAGSDALKNVYLAKLISGQWTGTMNLTEPQAGSDLAQLRTRAEIGSGGSYRIFGTKIFISYGEHDMVENIVHFVLARVKGAPEGVKGISLFLVPKFLVDAGGSIGARNDVRCVSIEHKMGIKASPTAVLSFGDGDGAIGYLVGEENRGLEYMFIMMNAARYAVGVQGIAVSERAYQRAVAYARERRQGRPVCDAASREVSIIHHPDVRRMLMTMRALIEGARATAITAAAACDVARRHPDAQLRQESKILYEFMVPLIKGYSTEISQEITATGIQVHGGIGFIEESGAAQYYRDCKILSIYEGTTAIQANDLVGRKISRDGGAFAREIAARIENTERELHTVGGNAASVMARELSAARQAYLAAIESIVFNVHADPNAAYAGSVPFLMLAGTLMGGWNLGRALLAAQAEIAQGRNDIFLLAKITTARFYAEHILPRSSALRHAIVHGSESVFSMPLEAF